MDNSALYYRINKLYDHFAASANTKGRYFFMMDLSLDTARWSPASVNMFALPGEYINHQSQFMKNCLSPDDAASFLADLQDASKGRLERKDTEWRMKTVEGNYVSCAVKIFTVKDYAGVPSYIGAAITSLDIDRHTDPTTNLPGQVRFLEYLRELFSTRRHAVILIMGTMNFNEVNDIYGYTFGNKVISTLADHLKDISGASGELFRGEGTILLFCSETMSAEEMTRLYQGQKNYAQHLLTVEGTKISLKLCAGIVVADDPSVDAHAILACAKFALSRSETEAEGQPIILKNDYLNQNGKTLQMVASLRSDVENDCKNMALFYQPVLNAENDRLIGSVAFLRWECEYGRISPAEFLPWLENDSSFIKLGDWILRRAISEGKQLLRSNPDMLLTINLSHRQLEQPEFHQTLLNILKRQEYPGRNLCLELTDRCRFMNLDNLRNEIVFFKSCGILVALDGSCLLDLHLVRELPVDIIKIGRDFTSQLKKSAKDRALLKALCMFAKESNIRVCAEGIEDKEMLDAIKSYGITCYQGFIVSGAIPFADFEKRMRADGTF